MIALKPYQERVLDSLNARFDTLTWRLAHRASAHIAPNDLRVDSVDLRSSAGARLFADGFAPATGPIRANVAASGVHLETVFRALQRVGASQASRSSPRMTCTNTRQRGHSPRLMAPKRCRCA